jgi:hypothetical protein
VEKVEETGAAMVVAAVAAVEALLVGVVGNAVAAR